MSQKTITKFFGFVISLTSVCLLFSGCFLVSSSNQKPKTENERNSNRYETAEIRGRLESSEITESSGLAASLCQSDVLWTHNDSGDEAFIFAINEKGERLGTWRVTNAQNADWEDLSAFKNAAGQCFLYIGDIGNNKRTRSEMTVYRVKEPTVKTDAKSSSKKNPLTTDPAEAVKFSYPEIRHDAETLMVHPETGDIYVLSKRVSGASAVYKLKGDFGSSKSQTLEKIADLSVPAIPDGLLTGGDISPDGRRVIVCDYFAAYEIVLPEKAKNFDEIWKQEPVTIELGRREQGEAVCYSSDGRSIFATSEKKNSPIIKVNLK